MCQPRTTRSGFLQKQEVYVRQMKNCVKVTVKRSITRSDSDAAADCLLPDTCCHGFSLCFFLCHGLELPCPRPVFWVCVCYFLRCCSESLLCHFSFDLKDFSLLRLGCFERRLFVLFTLQRFTWILFVKVRALFCLSLLKRCASSVFSEQFISCRKCLARIFNWLTGFGRSSLNQTFVKASALCLKFSTNVFDMWAFFFFYWHACFACN